MQCMRRSRPESPPSPAAQFHRDFHQSFGRNDIDVCVVFVDRTECYWLKWLKSGFRHCFVGLRIGDRWLICDSLKTHMELFLPDLPAAFDLPAFYASQGHTVLVGKKVEHESGSHLSAEFLTCVTVVKRILALRTSWIWTPWQLYRFLTGQTVGCECWHQIHSDNQREASFSLTFIHK